MKIMVGDLLFRFLRGSDGSFAAVTSHIAENDVFEIELETWAHTAGIFNISITSPIRDAVFDASGVVM